MCLAGPFLCGPPPHSARNRIIHEKKVSGPTKSTCCVTLTTCFEAGIGAPLEIPEELQRPTKHLTLVNVSTLDKLQRLRARCFATQPFTSIFGMEPSQIDRVSVADQVATVLRQRILGGEL